MKLVFSIPLTGPNWVYDGHGYLETQRFWMKFPGRFLGRIGYVFTGAVALWGAEARSWPCCRYHDGLIEVGASGLDYLIAMGRPL